MSTLLATLIVLPPLLAGSTGLWLHDVRRSQSLALWAAGASMLGASLVCLFGVLEPSPLTSLDHALDPNGVLPLFAALIGFVAVAMNPLSTGPRTFARIQLLNATSLASVLLHSPPLLCALWALQILVLLFELGSRPSTHAALRVCAFYLAPSVLLLAAATALHANGFATLGAHALLGAIWVRAALVPAHSWFPKLVQRAPLGIVVAFFSPLIPIRYFHAFFDTAWSSEVLALVSALGVVSAVFGASLAIVQQRARRALAYVLMSEGALVMFGLGAQGHARAVDSVWLATGLTTAGFCMAIAALEARRGPLHLNTPTGGYARVPLLATAFLILGLASVGLPGTYGFVAGDLLFGATFERHPWLTMTLLATTALNAITVLRCFFYLFMGPREIPGERDVLKREWLGLTLLLGVLILQGVLPNWGLRRLSPRPTTHSVSRASLHSSARFGACGIEIFPRFYLNRDLSRSGTSGA